ncbi:MAG: recombinase family protein [Candidatus Peregrinibacteria bacterium]|nr:recombinase family protein [Candidatus Peregrinibacteria bacterium]
MVQYNSPQVEKTQPQEALRYCLYARKSTEAEDKQALSIESQVKEMQALAEREHLHVVEIKRESHSSKEVGQRPIYNQMLGEVRAKKFNAILTWAPDRLSRNAIILFVKSLIFFIFGYFLTLQQKTAYLKPRLLADRPARSRLNKRLNGRAR